MGKLRRGSYQVRARVKHDGRLWVMLFERVSFERGSWAWREVGATGFASWSALLASKWSPDYDVRVFVKASERGPFSRKGWGV